MRIVVFDDYRIGAVEQDSVHDLTAALPGWHSGEPEFVNRFIAAFPTLRPALRHLIGESTGIPIDAVTLRAPTPRPQHVLAAPLNYQAHRAEMQGHLTSGPGTADTLGFFLKAPGSVSDPSQPVELPPFPDRRIDFEAEIAVVIGSRMRNVAPERALHHVFGYTILFDMTLRMTETAREERTMRKSYATFTPVGPSIVTGDEIPSPSDITLKAWRNGELAQDASLRDLIVPLPELLSRASQVFELQPGDVYATGSPAGVGQVQPGDNIAAESPQIGRLELQIARREW